MDAGRLRARADRAKPVGSLRFRGLKTPKNTSVFREFRHFQKILERAIANRYRLPITFVHQTASD